MNFKKRFKMRNLSLKVLYSFYGLSTLTFVYGLIKWQKVRSYHTWMFKDFDMSNIHHWSQYFFTEVKVMDISAVWMFLLLIPVDYLLKKALVRY